ncbi:Transporter of the ATP-binding cassette (ABC) [Polyrhizophydium stewartii]|uniref:Transporter of the ATP-binding cassette (ABC) n=1 Tax=Polyrhizophydium stewartii TaxID=2732419 RepID=A0ABR4N3S4_9FUNG
MFAWFNPMMQLGASRPLAMSDVWQLQRGQQMSHALREYDRAKLESNAPLLMLLVRGVWSRIVFQLSCQLVSSLLIIGAPSMLKGILDIIESQANGGDVDYRLAYLYAVGLFVLPALRVLVDGQASLSAKKVSVQVYSVLSGLVYRKSLRRPVGSGAAAAAAADAAETKSRAGGTQPEDKQAATVGKIVNLIAVDASKISDALPSAYTPFTTLLQIILCTAALLLLLGWPALVGISLMTIIIGSGTPLARLLRNSFKELNSSRDRRTNAMNEFLQGIRIIKFFAWEDKFAEKVLSLRQIEINNSIRAFLYGTSNRVLWYSTPIVVSITTFLSYTKIAGMDLSASLAFTSLALFNMIRLPLQMLPDAIIQLLDAWVSFTRIRDFLEEPELDHLPADSMVEVGEEGYDGRDAARASSTKVGFEAAEFSYLTEQEALNATANTVFRLYDADVTFPVGELSVVVGSTGSGKSSLLMALLGEMHRLAGSRYMPQGVAFAPQQAWLMNATIRDNITFGQPWDPELYARVVYACALTKDFALLDGGDMTEVGEKGINLSGGQKQRISLARACYNPSPVILLDDPLSAVDAPTASHIFENCILRLLAGRTCILVTNAVSLCLPQTNFLVVVEHGHVLAAGETISVLSSLDRDLEKSAFVESLTAIVPAILRDRAAAQQSPSAVVDQVPFETHEVIIASDTKHAAARLIEDEGMSTGRVASTVYYLYYAAAGGAKYYSLLFLGYALNHFFAISQDNWMRVWAQAYADVIHVPPQPSALLGALAAAPPVQEALASPFSSTFMTPLWSAAAANLTLVQPHTPAPVAALSAVDNDYYIRIYAIIGLLTMIAITARLVLSVYGNAWAGRNLHNQIFERVKRAPMRFFDTTPLGRIMNRFTKDVVACDYEVGIGLGNTMYNVVYTSFVLGTVSLVVPAFLVGLLPIALMYSSVAMFYIKTSRSLKRLDSVSKSPIFSHFAESINGVITIRAFDQRLRFVKENVRRIEIFNRTSYALFVSSQWLSVRIQLLGALVVFASAIAIIYSGINAGFAGLCLSLSLTLNEVLINLVRNLSFLEMSMNSVERINEYLQIDQEAPAVIPDNRPPQNWPHQGAVDIRSLSLKYSPDGPLVLRDLTVSFGAQEKIGVVGRTGAGKSTLTLALFRFIEPTQGSIEIDGIDIGSIGLHDLRSNLTIIPQDPILFSGTVRYNLDPFGVVDDVDLWAALRRAHLIDDGAGRVGETDGSSTLLGGHATSSGIDTSEDETQPLLASPVPRIDRVASQQSQGASPPRQQFSISLDTPVSEGGSNFSQGQRQLLCLARALARRSRVIVLDEATASVDAETDLRIQDTIRTEFADSTVITIAHRLKTVMDYDKILVLDKGSLAQFGAPSDLVRHDGIFRSMCAETNEIDELIRIADASRAQRLSRSA